VSIVAVRWRRFFPAARWNGHPPHTTTGAASVSDNHCQYLNCSAGIMDIATTGTVSAADTSSRCRHGRAGSSSATPTASSAGAGSRAS
jgi:hypothetical protein